MKNKMYNKMFWK